MKLIKKINSLKCLILIIFIQIICIEGFPTDPVTINGIYDNKNNDTFNMGNAFRSNPDSLKSFTSSELTTNRELLVKIKRTLKSFERLAITGNHTEIGNWKVYNAKLLTKKESHKDYEIWGITLKLPIDEIFRYRYFIASLDEKKIYVENWETHMEPRIVSIENRLDEYGVINKIHNIEKGWLTGESIVQLKFFDNPFICDRLTNKTKVGIKIIPITSDRLNSIDNIGFKAIQEPKINGDVKIEVSKFIYNQSQLVLQTEEETTYSSYDFIVYHITVRDLTKIGYLACLTFVDANNIRTSLGYQAILPSELKGSEGILEIPIISQTELKPIGFMKIRYLIIRPYPKAKTLGLETTFGRYWDPKWFNLDIGHRGLGASFKHLPKDQPPTTENTIAGFKESLASGADVVEFDVHLTKDLVPIIYHDFHVNVNFNEEPPTSIHDLTQMPINQLSYDQLKNLRIYHAVNTSKTVPTYALFEYPSHNEEERIDYRLFPTLEELFEKINKSIGFNIEIKWPQKFANGKDEAIQTIDKNVFVDKILSTLLEKGCGRFIYMSSFDADICTMLKFKQNMYPTMFLILSNSYKKNDLYEDPRCNTMTKAVSNCQAFNLLGVVAHTGNFVTDPKVVNIGRDLNQVVLTWGGHANSTNNINKLKKIGLHGVIYDRLDLYCEKTESIFNTDEYKKLFKQQCLN